MKKNIQRKEFDKEEYTYFTNGCICFHDCAIFPDMYPYTSYTCICTVYL